MKKKKEKRSDNTQEFIFDLSKFKHLKEFKTIEYKDMAKVIENHKTIIKDFTLSSGKVVLTSAGDKEFCSRIIWSFPTGNYDAFVHNDKDMRSIFIPFKKFSSKTVRYPLYFDTFHLPYEKTIPQFLKETETLFIIGNKFYLMDEEQWHKFKPLLYSKSYKTEEEIIEEINKKSNGLSPMILVNDFDNSKNNEAKEFVEFYIACCGYTLDGEPAFFWLIRFKQLVQE
jgi:hypothetical protein